MTNHHALAVALARQGDFASAIDHDARAFAGAPNDPTPIHHLMAIFVDCGKWIGAMAAIDLVKERPVSAELAVALDLVACEVMKRIAGVFPPAGMRADADAIVTRLVDGKHEVGMQLAIARMLLDINRVAEARRMVVVAEPQTPADRANAAFLRGVLCERESDLAGARAMYEQALALDPQRGDAAVNLISLLLQQNDLLRIDSLLAELAPEIRVVPELRFNEAMFLRRVGRIDDARTILSSVATPNTEIGRIAKQVLVAC